MVMKNEECLFNISKNILIPFKEHQIKLPGSRFKESKLNTSPYMLQNLSVKFDTILEGKYQAYPHAMWFFHGKLAVKFHIQIQS